MELLAVVAVVAMMILLAKNAKASTVTAKTRKPNELDQLAGATGASGAIAPRSGNGAVDYYPSSTPNELDQLNLQTEGDALSLLSSMDDQADPAGQWGGYWFDPAAHPVSEKGPYDGYVWRETPLANGRP